MSHINILIVVKNIEDTNFKYMYGIILEKDSFTHMET